MRKIDTSHLFERLDSALRDASVPVIATDADGTLWSGDVGVDSFESLLQSRAVRSAAQGRLREVSARYGIQADGDPSGLAATLYEAYKLGAFPEDDCYELMAWAFAGYSAHEARQLIIAALRARNLHERLHAEMLSVLDWARSRGVRVVVVSASPQHVVECGVELLGISPQDVVGTRTEEDDGVIAPRLSEPMPYGARKVIALQAAAPGADIIAAFGDNVFDLPMLRTATIPVAIRPKTRLRDAPDQPDNLAELTLE